MKQFMINHFDTIITVGITILGFIITYLMTKKNFRDGIRKDKISLTLQEIHSLPYDICQLMDEMVKNKTKKPEEFAKEYASILSKVLAFGSNEAIKIAIKMQQLSYNSAVELSGNSYKLLIAYALLITQLKFDLTSEIISPEKWFELRMTDYPKIKESIRKDINQMISELELNPGFSI